MISRLQLALRLKMLFDLEAKPAKDRSKEDNAKVKALRAGIAAELQPIITQAGVKPADEVAYTTEEAVHAE